jgi:hypothetical protein
MYLLAVIYRWKTSILQFYRVTLTNLSFEWQFKVTQGCQHHSLSLLSECPNCGARFKVPALWVDGWCQRCFTPFGEMVKSQKSM